MMIRYGKSSSSLLSQKTSFFEENELHIKKQREMALIYKKQPKRKNCKNCNAKIDLSSDFTKDGIDYVFCDYCQHLNGIYEDTDEFSNAIYSFDLEKMYLDCYKSENKDSYDYRTESIYVPKAEFLYASLQDNNINPHSLEYIDYGAGSGYFVAALKKIGIKRVSGIDVSKSQVDYGNTMLGDKLLKLYSIEDTIKIFRELKSQVVSMIGVLEHLQKPREVLKELKHNNNVKFLYISVPIFSFSVYLEILSPDVFHRHLRSGHTHLYTRKSLSYLMKEFGFEAISEWWFGTDMVDLFRHISVTLKKTNSSKKLMELWRQDFIPFIDEMQLMLDKKHFSSDVHMVLKKV